MHLAYLVLVISSGLCLGESFIEEIPNHNEALADRLALLEKKMMGLEEENKYLRLVIAMIDMSASISKLCPSEQSQ